MPAAGPRYLVAGSRPWNRVLFDELALFDGDEWEFAATPAELDAALAQSPTPVFVFFLHWSSIVPPRIFEAHECVLFHMTDVPYGRGGSPLQNLIVRGHTETVVSAIRMTGEVDAGPVYAKAPLALDGTAEAILERAGRVSAALMERIIADRPAPQPQEGEVVPFERRTPEQSELPTSAGLDAVEDHIRMLDADGYPYAFLEVGALRLEMRNAVRKAGRISATVEISLRDETAKP